LNDFIKHLKQTGSITRKSGRGRPRTARTTANRSRDTAHFNELCSLQNGISDIFANNMA